MIEEEEEDNDKTFTSHHELLPTQKKRVKDVVSSSEEEEVFACADDDNNDKGAISIGAREMTAELAVKPHARASKRSAVLSRAKIADVFIALVGFHKIRIGKFLGKGSFSNVHDITEVCCIVTRATATTTTIEDGIHRRRCDPIQSHEIRCWHGRPGIGGNVPAKSAASQHNQSEGIDGGCSQELRQGERKTWVHEAEERLRFETYCMCKLALERCSLLL